MPLYWAKSSFFYNFIKPKRIKTVKGFICSTKRGPAIRKPSIAGQTISPGAYK